MKVILSEDVRKLGVKGQILEVSDGYARNYLIPRGLAQEATVSRLKEARETSNREERRKSQEKAQAEEIKARLEGQKVEIKAKTGGGNKLFGAVTAREVSEILQKEFGVAIDKKKIELGEPIKHLGEYPIIIKLYPSIPVKIKLVVSPE